jgi:hypothetical protein
MSDLEKAAATQLANIQKKTGKSTASLFAAIKKSGLSKHGEIRTWLMETFGLGHGDANALIHAAKAGADPAGKSGADILDEIYVAKKAHLRPVHEKLMKEIGAFGEFEVAPKKGYVSLRRKKQFAMLGPKTNDRFELGINLKEAVDDPRFAAQPTGGMCHYVVALTTPGEVDAAIIAVLKRAFAAAG